MKRGAKPPKSTKGSSWDYNALWRFAYEAYKGSGGFSDGAYLDQYPRESDEKYRVRRQIAYYANLFEPNVAR